MAIGVIHGSSMDELGHLAYKPIEWSRHIEFMKYQVTETRHLIEGTDGNPWF